MPVSIYLWSLSWNRSVRTIPVHSEYLTVCEMENKDKEREKEKRAIPERKRQSDTIERYIVVRETE